MNAPTPASSPAAPPRNWLRIASIALFILGGTLYGIRCVRSAHWSYTPQDATAKGGRGNDFTAFYSAGELARLHENIYDFTLSSTPRRPFVYPPLFALLPMAPLSLLRHDAAHAVFFALGLALVFLTCWILARWLWPPGYAPVSIWRSVDFGLFAAIALCWRFFHANCNDGNSNFYILFLVVAGLHLLLFAKQNGARPLTGIGGGLAIALATVFKVTPGLFGVYFLWSRKGWAMVGGAVGIVVFLFLLPSLWFGWEKNTEYVTAFTTVIFRKAVGTTSDIDDNKVGDIIIGRQRPLETDTIGLGVSLRGALTALLTPAVVLKQSYHGGRRSVNIVELSEAQAKTVTKVCLLLLLLATVVLTFPEKARATAIHEALAWSLVTVAMTLLSPMTRPAHLVVLLLPVAALIALLQQNRLAGASKKLAWSALVVLGLGEVLVSKDIIGEHSTEVLSAMGFTTASMLLLFVALAAALRNVSSTPTGS